MAAKRKAEDLELTSYKKTASKRLNASSFQAREDAESTTRAHQKAHDSTGTKSDPISISTSSSSSCEYRPIATTSAPI